MAMADERDDDAQNESHGDGSFTNRDNGVIKGRRDDAVGGTFGTDEGFSERVSGFVERCKALQEDASLHASRSQSKDNALGRQAVAILMEIKRLRAALVVYCERDELQLDVADQLDEGLCKARSLIYEGDVACLLPSKDNGVFLRMLLGPVNVRATCNDIRYKVKEEYNEYRDRTAVLFLAFPVVLLFLKKKASSGCFPALPVQLYQAWLLLFYTSLALRENILRVNGSDIRPWWVYHHYCAMFTALVTLTWGIQGQPSCICKQQGVQLFLEWAVMQGVAMLLQNHYQRQRLYTRIALGKARRMDVVWGETAGVEGQICKLYPLMFLLQGFQFYIGVLVLRTAWIDSQPEWQMVLSGLLLLAMAVGNFISTIATVHTKVQFKAKMKKKGKHMLPLRTLSMDITPKKLY